MQHARTELEGAVERPAHLIESGKSPQYRHQFTGFPKRECNFGRPLEHRQYPLIRVAESGDERFPEQNSGRQDRARLRGVGHSLGKSNGAARVPFGFDECTGSQRRTPRHGGTVLWQPPDRRRVPGGAPVPSGSTESAVRDTVSSRSAILRWAARRSR